MGMNILKNYFQDEEGMGTVEVILIIVEIYINYLYVFNVYIRE